MKRLVFYTLFVACIALIDVHNKNELDYNTFKVPTEYLEINYDDICIVKP